VVLSSLLATAALAQDWREDFETGLGAAKTCFEPPDGMTLEIVAGGAAEGKCFLRGTLPGKRPPEGLNLTATGLRGGRVATVTAQVRGAGELWLCLIARNGWLYSLGTVPLTDRWQSVSLSQVLVRADTSLGIHFVSHPDSPRAPAVYEVDDVRVALAPPPRTDDTDMGPWRFEAEEFSLQPEWVTDEAQASGGQVTRHERTMAIAVEATGTRFTADTWKLASADTKDAARAGLDDGPWPLAARVANHPQWGPVVGIPGKPVVLRRTLLWEKTRVWPTPEPAFYLARGSTQHSSAIADGLPGRRIEGWTVTVAAPPPIEIVGSSGFYGTTSPDPPQFRWTQFGMQTVNGRTMRLAKVAADKPILAGRHPIMSLFGLFLRTDATALLASACAQPSPPTSSPGS